LVIVHNISKGAAVPATSVRSLERRPEPLSTIEVDKARTDIESHGFTIIANVRDQESDLVGDQTGRHAERTFKVPNPFYFIP
jgi:acid phosphatase